jgi:hypothetical protein
MTKLRNIKVSKADQEAWQFIFVKFPFQKFRAPFFS